MQPLIRPILYASAMLIAASAAREAGLSDGAALATMFVVLATYFATGGGCGARAGAR